MEERLERVAKERPVLPSELLEKKQLYFQCGEEITTRRDIELFGDDCLLWAPTPARSHPHQHTRGGQRTFRSQRFASTSEEKDYLRQRQAVLQAVIFNLFKSFNPPDQVRGPFNRCAPLKRFERLERFDPVIAVP